MRPLPGFHSRLYNSVSAFFFSNPISILLECVSVCVNPADFAGVLLLPSDLFIIFIDIYILLYHELSSLFS